MKIQNKDFASLKKNLDKEKKKYKEKQLQTEEKDLDNVKIVDIPTSDIEKEEDEEYKGDIFDDELSGVTYPVEPDEEKAEEVEEVEEETTKEDKNEEEKEEIKPLEEIEQKIAKDNTIEELSAPELLELVIYEEIDDMIKKDFYELQEMDLEIDILNNKEEDLVLKEEVEELEKEIQKLIYRFNEIAIKYDYIYEKLDYDEIRSLDNKYLNGLMNDLTDKSLLNEIIKKPEDLEEYINVVNKLVEIENKKSDIEEKIEEKKNKFDIRDEEFERLKEEYENTERIQQYIEDFNKTQEDTLAKIQKLVEEAPEISRTIEHRQNLNFHIGNAISGNLLLAGAAFMPPTRRGNMMRIAMLIMGINRLRHILVPTEEEKVTIQKTAKDYSKSINESIKDVNLVLKDLDNAFDDIKTIREKIKSELGEYIDQIPEFKNLLINLNKLEKELVIQASLAKNYSNDFDKVLTENNEKIKRLDIHQG